VSKKAIIVKEEQEEEWEVTQIVAKRMTDGVVEVILQYVQRWQVVDDCIADGPLYNKILADEAAEAAVKYGTSVASVGSDVAKQDADAVEEEEDKKEDAKKDVKKDAKDDAKKMKVDRPRRACNQ
jgi:hypothetical protein